MEYGAWKETTVHIVGSLFVIFRMKLTNAQIGKSGELLVQYKLLKYGIESSQLTTDTGIDLVAFSSKKEKAFTIQVKTNLNPKPGGGSGKLALDWWLRDNSPADIVALVDLSTDRIWMFLDKEFSKNAQQHSKNKYHLYMYVDQSAKSIKHKKYLDAHFVNYLIENKLGKIF